MGSHGEKRCLASILLFLTVSLVTTQLLQRKVCPFVKKYKTGSECSNPSHQCLDDSFCETGKRCCPQDNECPYSCRLTVPPRGCPIPIDLSFVLDSSGSIGRRNWVKVKNFVKGIIDYFDISDKGTHVGIVMYSSDASVQLYFNDFKGPDLNNVNVKRVVDDLVLEKGLTFIDKGLNVSYQQLFRVEKGMRPHRKKVCLVITDGIQTKNRGPYTRLDIASAPLKELGIVMYALGIGKNVKKDELLAVGSGPEYVYTAKTFDELQTEVEGISKAQCQACGSRVDVIFGIPDASNLGKEFQAIQSFFVKLASLFQVNAKTSHIGLVRYNDNADMVLGLDQMYSIPEISNFIKGMKPRGNSLDVERALDVAADVGFTIFGGVRQTAPKTYIIFIPENVSQKPSTPETANKLKEMGVRIIMVGITNKIDTSLSVLASQPPLRHFVSGIDYDALAVAAYEIADSACKARYGKCQASLTLDSCPDDLTDACDVDKDCHDNNYICCKGDCGRICQDRIKNCLITMDVAIAIDSSSQVTDEEFDQMKSFTNHLIHSLSGSENAVRFSVIQYDNATKILTRFRSFKNSAKLKSTINDLKRSTIVGGRVHAALFSIKDELFSIKGGMRQGHPRFVIILTSGGSTDSKETAKASEILRKARVNIFAVGIRAEVEKSHLNSLATQPSMTFRPTIGQELPLLWPKIASQMCSAKPGSCPLPVQDVCSGKREILISDIPCGETAGYGVRSDKINDWDCPGEQKCCLDPSACLYLCQKPPNTCDGQYDIALLLESTDDIGLDGYQKVKKFAIQLLDAFTIWQAASRVAVITFGSTHKVNLRFNSLSGSILNKQSVSSQIWELPLIGGAGLSTSDALQSVLEDIFTVSGGSRENANKSLVIISQGKFSDSSKAIKIASDLRNALVDVFAVAIGPSPDLDTISKLVSKPFEKNIFMTTSFNALTPNVRALNKAICQGANKVKICKEPLDVVFAIPSSEGPSLKGAEDVFKSIIALLKVDSLDVRVGLETYSETADVNVNIDSGYNKDNITEYFNKLKGIGKKVDLEQALKTAHGSAFSIFSGIRQTSPKALILLVPEGALISGASISDASKNLRGLGVRLFVIGLENALDKSLVKTLVSQPAQKFIYTAQNYNELAALGSEIVDSLCRGRYGKCPIATPISTCPEKTTSKCLLDKDCNQAEHKCCEDQCGSSACIKGVDSCFITMDVAIALDSSSDISDAEFNQAKTFASHLIHSLVNAENAIRFALMQYSQEAKTLVDFRRVTTESILKSIVKNMKKFPKSSPRVDTALSTMGEEVFSLSGGMRQGHPRFAIFLTSGTTSKASGNLEKASEYLRKLDVKIIAIGISKSVNHRFVDALASEKQFSFTLRSPSELQTLWPKLAQQMCSAKPGTCPAVTQKSCAVKPQIDDKQIPCGDTAGKTGLTSKENDWGCPGEMKCCLDTTGCLYLCQDPPNECNGQFDIAFILEAPSSMGIHGLNRVKNLANRVADAFTISSSSTRVALITHAESGAVVSLKFGTVAALSSETAKNSIKNVQFAGKRGEALSQALQVALSEVYTSSNGMRESSNKSIVIIGHGVMKNVGKVIDLAKKIKQKGIDIFAVPIGPNVDVSTLSKVVSKPINRNIFMTTSYNALRPNVRALTETICSGAQKVIVCDQPNDVIFGIPISQRLGSNLNDIKDVFKSILDLLIVNKMQIHVGVETYSDMAQFPVNIDATYDSDRIFGFISRIRADKAGINLESAFNVASNRGFTIYGGVRQTSPKVFIILVPGIPSNNEISLVAAARKLKSLGVKIFIIGPNKVVNTRKIKALSSHPPAKYVYGANSYPDLALQAYKIVNTLCKGRYGRCNYPVSPNQAESCQEVSLPECIVDKHCASSDHMCCQDGCGAGKCVQRIKNCFVPSEIVFALDVSESTTTKDFSTMKEIVLGILRYLANSQNNIHIGLMTYASRASLLTRGFRDNISEEELEGILHSLETTVETRARLDLAMRMAKREFFSPKGGMRHGHPKYLVVLASTNPASGFDDMNSATEALKETGVNIISVGMSLAVKKSFLQKLATDYWTMLKESSPKGIIMDISSKICHEKPGKCPAVLQANLNSCISGVVPAELIPCGPSSKRSSRSIGRYDWDCPGETKCCVDPNNGCHHVCVQPPLECSKNKDVLFMVESTSHFDPPGFERLKTFIKQVLSAFDVSESSTRVSLMAYNNRPTIILRFDSFQRGTLTRANIMERLDRMKYTDVSSASIYKGFEAAGTTIFESSGSFMDDYNKTIVVFTSGRYTNPQRTIKAALILKEDLIDVFAVAIGSKPDVENMEKTVSLKSDKNIFVVPSTTALKPQLRALVRTICDGALKHGSVGQDKYIS